MCICITACFVLEFSRCVSHSATLSPNGMTSCGDRCETVVVWNQNTDAICDYRPQNTLLLKGARTNCLYMLMPKVCGFLWCLCYILVQFPLYSRVQDWNMRQLHSYVARTIIHVSWLHSWITACHFARCQQPWVLLGDVGSCPPAGFPN